MVAEAHRIIENNDLNAAPISIKLNRRKKLKWFALGLIISCALWAVAIILRIL